MDEVEARAVARPLPALALAAVLGGALGRDRLLPAPVLTLLALLAIVVAVTLAREAPARGPAGVGARAALPLAAPLVVWCLALAFAFAARGPIEGAREAVVPDGAALVGTWRAAPSPVDGSRGRLTGVQGGGARGAGVALLVESGTLVDGERVAVRPSGAPLRAAAGPVAAPGSSGAGRGPRELLPVLPDEVVRLGPPARSPFARWQAALAPGRRALARRLGTLDDPRTAGLATALVLGDGRALPTATADLFARTGTLHLLAVSGLHVGLVAWLLFGPVGRAAGRLFRRGRNGRRAAAPLVEDGVRLLLLAVYVPLVGTRPPVVRAALAFALVVLARHLPARRRAADGTALRRRADALSVWSIALLLECAADPGAYASPSVGLSYGATLGLVVGFAPLRARVASLLPNGGRIAPVDRLGRERAARWRVPAQRATEIALAGVCASTVAVLGALPVAWTTFGEIAPAGVLATPALVPVTTALLVAGWVHALLPALAPSALLDALAGTMLGLLEHVDRLPGTPVTLPPRPFALVACAAAATLGALRSTSLTRVACGLGGVLLVPWSAAPRALELHALDVGAGTAVVLRAPGAGTWIFDAGSRDRFGVARAALAPLLARWETGPVAVVLSHRHRDHRSALPWLVERYPVRLWAGALPAHLAERLPHSTTVLDGGPGPVLLPLPRGRGSRARGRLDLWRGTTDELEGEAGNEGSRTLVVAWGGLRAVLSGDAEAHGLDRLLALGALDGPVDVLLAPHHGSETPHLGRLLDRARPAEVWISSGPSPPILPELERRGIPWRWTGRDGPLALGGPPRAGSRPDPPTTGEGPTATGTETAPRAR